MFGRRRESEPHSYQYNPMHESFYENFETKWDEERDPEYADWKRVRSAMEHENYLLFERAKLLTTSQAFLFTTYALIFTSDRFEKHPSWFFLLLVISLAAIVMSAFISVGMYEARHQHRKLEKWWRSRVGDPIPENSPVNSKQTSDWSTFLEFPYLKIIAKNISSVEASERVTTDEYECISDNEFYSIKKKLRHPPICGTDPARPPLFDKTSYHIYAMFFFYIWLLISVITIGFAVNRVFGTVT